MSAVGTVVITVARDGARTANCGNGISCPIWVTAIYRAQRRVSDEVITWRRVGSIGRGVSGFRPSQRLIQQSRDYAVTRGVEYREQVRHGDIV